jgi:hypothetical protein
MAVYMGLMPSGHPVIQTVFEISDKNVTKECKKDFSFLSNASSHTVLLVWHG